MPLPPDIIDARIRTIEEHIRSENMHDLDAIMATFGSQAQYEDEAWGERHEGRLAVRGYYEDLIRAAPDLTIDVRRRHITEECIILEVEIRGTHQGIFRGAPGTGRPLRFPLWAIYSFDEQNRLIGERIFYDRVTVLQQMGLLHNPSGLLGRLTTVLCHPMTMAKAGVRMLFRK